MNKILNCRLATSANEDEVKDATICSMLKFDYIRHIIIMLLNLMLVKFEIIVDMCMLCLKAFCVNQSNDLLIDCNLVKA